VIVDGAPLPTVSAASLPQEQQPRTARERMILDLTDALRGATLDGDTKAMQVAITALAGLVGTPPSSVATGRARS
jgi:hypothetical protein